MTAHPQFEEDFELYGLGVLDGDDKAGFERHLAECAQCVQKVAAAMVRLAPLGFTAPPSEPPTGARQRLLEPFRRPPARSGFWSLNWAWAAACLTLVAVAAWTTFDNSRLSKRLAEIEASQKQLEISTAEMKAAAAQAQSVLEILTGPQTIQVDLSPSTAHPVPHGKAFYNRSRGLLFYTTNLPTLPSGRTYELWLIPTEGKPIDAGLFNTDSQGNGQVILPSLPTGLTAKAFAVTAEPAGGVPAPTGSILLVGPAS